MICGSVNAVTRRQLEKAEAAGFGNVRLGNRQKLTDWIRTAEGAKTLEAWGRQIEGSSGFFIDTNDVPGEESAAAWGQARGMNVLQVGDTIANTLAYAVRYFLDREIRRLLLLTGGDVLFHAMREMGVKELTPLAEVEPGVILAEFRYGDRKCRVLTKSGGFGTEHVMVRLAGEISERGAEEAV